METEPHTANTSTQDKVEDTIRLYLSQREGALISPTDSYQTAVLDGERVDANVAKAVSLNEVGRMPLRFAMEA